jgi:hypothetical protein
MYVIRILILRRGICAAKNLVSAVIYLGNMYLTHMYLTHTYLTHTYLTHNFYYYYYL